MVSSGLSMAVAIVLLLGVFLASADATSCVSFSSKFCSPVINSYTSQRTYGVPDLLIIYENVINESLMNFTLVVPILAPDCYTATRKFLCGYYFPECDNTTSTKVPVCHSLCTDFLAACSSVLSPDQISSFPTCSQAPDTTNCNLVNNLAPLDRSNITCPSPLVKNHDGKNRTTCPGGLCCVPCPIAANFFPEGQLLRGGVIFNAVNFVFSFFSLVTFIAYIALPSKRKFPQNVITYLSAALVIVYLYTYIGLFSAPESLLCTSPLDSSASDGPVPPACSAQGTFLVFGFLSAIFWFSCLSINLFLIVVLRLSIPDYVEYIYHAFCWGVPLIAIIILNSRHQVGTAIAPFCGIGSNDYANGVLLGPSAVIMFPAIVLNAIIIVRVSMVALQVKKSFLAVIQLQFRPLLFSTYAISVFIGFWIYQQVGNTETWVEDWFVCILMGYGQNVCSGVSEPFLNTVASVTAVYIILGSVGPVAFFLFVCKRDVYEGWKELITGKSTSEYSRNYVTDYTPNKSKGAAGGTEQGGVSASTDAIAMDAESRS